jgi:hypothetical protein
MEGGYLWWRIGSSNEPSCVQHIIDKTAEEQLITKLVHMIDMWYAMIISFTDIFTNYQFGCFGVNVQVI